MDLTVPLALVVGSEGKEFPDWCGNGAITWPIPMSGKIDNLNSCCMQYGPMKYRDKEFFVVISPVTGRSVDFL